MQKIKQPTMIFKANVKLPISAACLATLLGCGGGSSPLPSDTNAAACFKTARYAAGDTVIRFTTSTNTYNSLGITTATEDQKVEKTTVLPSVIFNGYTTTKIQSQNISNSNTNPKTNSELLNLLALSQSAFFNYSNFDGSNFINYGYEAIGTNVADTSTYSPPTNINLAGITLGGSTSYTITGSTISTLHGVTQPPSAFSQSITMKFAGFELVSTPAGTISTCRIDSTGSTPSQSFSSSDWYSTKDGILVKSIYQSTATISPGQPTISSRTEVLMPGSTINNIAVTF